MEYREEPVRHESDCRLRESGSTNNKPWPDRQRHSMNQSDEQDMEKIAPGDIQILLEIGIIHHAQGLHNIS